MRLRLANGRFISDKCPDPHCGGTLVYDLDDRQPIIRCDGLTYTDEAAPLIACRVEFEAKP